MSSQQTDTSTSNANWGTLVILVWVALGAVLVGYLIKNGELDSKTSDVTYSAPGAPAAEPAPLTVPAAARPTPTVETTTPSSTPVAPATETPASPAATAPTETPAPSTAPTPAPSTTM